MNCHGLSWDRHGIAMVYHGLPLVVMEGIGQGIACIVIGWYGFSWDIMDCHWFSLVDMD